MRVHTSFSSSMQGAASWWDLYLQSVWAVDQVQCWTGLPHVPALQRGNCRHTCLAWLALSANIPQCSKTPCMLVYRDAPNILFSRVRVHGRLKFTGQKKGVGAYTKKPFIFIMHIYVNHRIIKSGVCMSAYTEMGAYSGEYSTYFSILVQLSSVMVLILLYYTS